MIICASVVELKESNDQIEEPASSRASEILVAEAEEEVGYELGDIISENDAATIYDAQRPGLSKALVYKSFQKNLSPQAKDRFEETCAAAKALDHPNIAAVLEYGFADDACPFIVSEKAEGTALSAVLSVRGALNAVTTTAVFCQILDALEYAAAQDIWLGDMTPDRIFVCGLESDAPVVKIVGIGTSRNAFEKDISAKSMINDPFAANYASPERCLGKETDARSIVYSIGCMLYEVIFGKRAFEGTDQIKLLFDHVNGTNLTLPTATRSGFGRLWKVVNKCLQSKPEVRFKDLATLRHHLENIEEPIKNEQEATPWQVLAMHLTGARTPIGGELFVAWAIVIATAMSGPVISNYSREVQKLETDIQQTRFSPMADGRTPSEMIKKWEDFRKRGASLGQSRVFDADCDINIANWMMSNNSQSDAFEHFRRAARTYNINKMPADEYAALNSAIGVYFYHEYDPFSIAPDMNVGAHFSQLAPLMSRRISLVYRHLRIDEYSMRRAYLDHADLYMMNNDWQGAKLTLDLFQSKFPTFVDAEVTTRLGICYEHLQKPAKAEYWYRKALEMDSSPWGRKSIEDAINRLSLESA
jgi:serine/threonine protein kinase